MKYLLPFILFFIAITLSAQGQMVIKGALVDSLTKQPLAFATVALLPTGTTEPVASTLTKDNGSFVLSVPGGKYRLRLDYVGYHSKMIAIPQNRSDTVNLGIITLTSQSGQLKEVSIIGTKPVMKQDIDKLSYDVQADPESKTKDALEMMRKVPMITVDGNDNITLNGSSSYQIFINGKPSALMATSPADVLKGMPAATIQKIEVITNPPAKYDAEGLAGIINIITTQKTDEGYNVSLFTRYNNVYGTRGSASITFKKGKFGFNTILGLGHQGLVKGEGDIQLNTFNPSQALEQQGSAFNGGNFNNDVTQLSYEIDTLHLLTASIDYFIRRFAQNNDPFSQLLSAGDMVLQAYQLNNTGLIDRGGFDAGANYQLGFAHQKGRLLTFSYQYNSYFNNQGNILSYTDQLNSDLTGYDQQNNTGSTSHTLQADYVQPFKNLTLEAGGKIILRDLYSDFTGADLDPASGMYIPDTAQADRFSYHQNVYSLYNSYELKQASRTFEAGLRAELTSISSDLVSNPAAFDRHYLNLIPALSIQQALSGGGSFVLGYTARIQRPGLQQLNPFVDQSNPNLLTTGNPGLDPVVSHQLQLSYSKFSKLGINASLNYAFSGNTIQPVTKLLNDTVSKTTYANIGNSKRVNANLSLSYPVSTKLNVSMNGQLAYLWLMGSYDSQIYSQQGYLGYFDANAGYKFDQGLRFNGEAGYNSGNIDLQVRSNHYFYNSVSANKDLFGNRANVSLTIYDPFAQYVTFTDKTNTTDLAELNSLRNLNRSFRFGFTYKFGHLNSSIKTNKRGIKNDDVPGNNKEN